MSCCNQHTYFDQYKVAGAKQTMFNNTGYYKQIQAYTNQPQVVEGFAFESPSARFSTAASLVTPPQKPMVVSIARVGGAPILAMPPNQFAGPRGAAPFSAAAPGQVVKYAQTYPAIDMHPGASTMASIGGYQFQNSAYSNDTQTVYVTGSCTM